MKKVLKKVIAIFIILGILTLPSILAIDRYVQNIGSKYIEDPMIIPEADAILVLGAYVFPDGTVSDMLNDRLTIGHELYSQGKAPKIIGI